MGVLKKLAQTWVETGEFLDFMDAKQRHQDSLQVFWEEYWRIALTLWELVRANHSVIKVHAPSEPIGLQLPNLEPKQLSVFPYSLTLSNSCNDGEAAASPLKVKHILEVGLATLGFSGIEVKCRPDSNHYYITVVGSAGYILGRPMSPRFGVLFVNQFYNALTDFYIDAFDVRFFDGSKYGWIRDNAIIKLYHNGQLVPSITRRDINFNPVLSRLPPKPRPDFGYLVIV